MNASTHVLDLRELKKTAWTRNISNLLELLHQGESVVLVSESDPKSIIEEVVTDKQFKLEIEYLAQGQPVWKLKLNKIQDSSSKEGCCGCCGD